MNREEQAYSTNTGEFIAEKLLPCPFCGSEPEFITIGDDYTKSWKAEIKCTKCFVKRTTGAIRNDLEWCGRKAIELWNKRTNGPSLPPAEGAEAILHRHIDKQSMDELSVNVWPDMLEAMHEFAAQPQPTAEGAETILKEGLDDGRYADITDGINIDVKQPFYQAIIRYAEDVVASQQQPTAEGAEEILRKNCNTCYSRSTGEEEVWSSVSSVLIAMQDFATLHAQRIAEGAEEIEAELRGYARDIVRLHKPIMEVNPQLAMDSIGNDLVKMFNRLAQRLAEKMVSEKLREELMGFRSYFNNLGLKDNILIRDVDEYLKTQENEKY